MKTSDKGTVNMQEMSMNELEQVNGGGLLEWVAQHIAAPIQEHFEAKELDIAQMIGEPRLRKGT